MGFPKDARQKKYLSHSLAPALREDDFKAGVRRLLPFAMKHKEDYLLFWADEHTHFNYAMQWFGMGAEAERGRTDIVVT